MPSDGVYGSQWPGGNENTPADTPTMSATSGPVESFYWPGRSTPTPSKNELAPAAPDSDAARSTSRSPAPQQPRAGLSTPNHTLSNAKSTPVLLPSRPAGSVKNIANRFDQAGTAGIAQPPQLTVRTSHDRYRRPVAPKSPKSPRSPPKDGVRKLQRSPPKEVAMRLQKRQPRSPAKSPSTSFDPPTSFESTTTVMSTKSQPHSAFNPKQQSHGQYFNARPLFGEITSDGRWNGNFDLGITGPLSDFTQSHRRSSDGNILSHGRSRSHQEVLQPVSATALSPPKQHALSHKRSRSEMDAPSSPQPSSVPQSYLQPMPGMYPTPPNSGTRHAVPKDSPASRIPISNRRQSHDSGSSGPRSRSTSELSDPIATRNRLSKSPTRKNPAVPKENVPPSGFARSRYHPPPIPTESSGQTLSAKIVAPLPKTSPPLRSSRPRQPVSSATTSASRARAAERYQGPATRDGRRPSEQWLGKPYDPQQERSKRKIPELGKIDFAARRERIQKAISQNLEEQKSLESLRTRSRSRQPSQEQEKRVAATEEVDAVNSADERQAEEMNRETDAMPGGWPTPGLSVDTFHLPDMRGREPEPNSARTEFELDESPTLGRPATQEREDLAPQIEQPVLLTSAIYQRSPAKTMPPLPISPVHEVPAEEVQSPSVLENVMRMRQHDSQQASRSGGDDAEDGIPASAEDSASDLEERWGLATGLQSVNGSIRIMLDSDPAAGYQPQSSWSRSVHDSFDHVNSNAYTGHDHARVFAANGYTDSPVEDRSAFKQRVHQTSTDDATQEDTLRSTLR